MERIDEVPTNQSSLDHDDEGEHHQEQDDEVVITAKDGGANESSGPCCDQDVNNVDDGNGTITPPTQSVQQRMRLANRLRRWQVTFGNPALGTYAGSIVTLHPRSRRRQRLLLGDDYQSTSSDDSNENDGNSESSEDNYEDDDSSYESSSSDDSFSSCSSVESIPSGGDKSTTQRIAVMANVPPHQVPDGVLNLVRGHRPFVEHVRIVIGSSRFEEAEYRRRRRNIREMRARYEREAEMEEQGNNQEHSKAAVRRSRSQTWACENEAIDDDGGTTSSNLVDGYMMSAGSSMSKHGSDENSKMGTRGSRSTSLDISAHFPYDNNLDGRSGYAEIDNTTGYEEEKYDEEKYEAEPEPEPEPDNHQQQQHENEEKSYHILFVLDSEDSADTFVSDLHHRPYTSLDENETCSVYRAAHVKGEDGVSLLGPFFASSTSSPNDNVPPSAKDESQCPVCLENFILPSQPSTTTASSTLADASSSILTTVCNHSFHIDCLARWQDSPCPVCRYDHSGLNEALSRCHVCSTTVRNYVCLICGVVSCANGPSFTALSTGEGADQAPQTPSHLGHALQHYEESLHAYALDTETQHVWDFAGGGYVHRLLQNSEDGKIVEGTDPRLMEEERGMSLLDEGGGDGEASMPLSALERSTIPTYSSSAEDDEAIHRKLEGFAGQYYTLLKSQLEQQRIFYEGRLEAIRREHEITTQNERQSTAHLISALKQERNQLEQRCVTLRRKHKKVTDDAKFLENMNESLEADKHAFRNQIAVAQGELAEARELTQQLLGPLEEKVSLLMLQLESGMGGVDVAPVVDDRKPSSK